jgi:UDP-N-acetylmuramate: L-alanyl-gamma-D-glutamyl-meso-diaminopimelate ligase
VLVMSNGGFGGVHQKLLDALSARPATKERA